MPISWLAAGAVFLITFILICVEKLHPTILAMAGAVVMLLLGKIMGFYSTNQAIAAIDFNTLGLLLGMMLLVSILGETGFFQYLAIIAGQKSGGSPWKLMIFLGTLCAFTSMILDNVTTIVILAPITIAIAEMLCLNPLPLLLAEALLSNIGGVATLVGDPPNIMIASAAGFNFNQFLKFLAPISIVCFILSLLLLKWIFRKELNQQPAGLENLKQKDPKLSITDPVNLKKTLIILGAVVLLFFVHHLLHLEPSVVALLGATAALIWTRPELPRILAKVEWEVLLFFAALFVVVGGLKEAGLLSALAGSILSLAKSNLLLTSLILLWGAAILSAFLDNIPFTMAMIPVIQQLSSMGVPAEPLWWALALGAGLGGNGTPIGASANVLVTAICRKNNVPISFALWFKSGSLVTLATCLAATLLFMLFFKFMH